MRAGGVLLPSRCDTLLRCIRLLPLCTTICLLFPCIVEE
jgi:hypothetical protein